MKFQKILAMACTGLIMTFAGAGAALAAPINAEETKNIQEYSADDGYDIVLDYVTNENGEVRFNHERAVADGASAELIEVGNFINLYAFAAEADKNNRLSLPLWGNWCGPGHSGPGDPVDYLDTACMHHDKCYGTKGYFNCSCDQALIDEINRNYSKMKAAEKVAARAVQAYFTAQKLVCRK